jgi:hypothetical protein
MKVGGYQIHGEVARLIYTLSACNGMELENNVNGKLR